MRPKGFTLTEMLVVIVVIAVLLALAFSGFNKAMSSSRSATCLSNLRQIGVGMNLYADEHGDKYPTMYADIGNDGQTWMWALKSYMNMADDSMGLSPLPKAAGVFICPDLQQLTPRDAAYAENMWMANNNGIWKYQRSIIPQSSTIIVAEISYNGDGASPTGSYGGAVVRRHPNDSANYLFADGHVENIKGAIPSTDSRWFQP